MRPASSQMDLWPSLGLELDWSTLFAFSKRSEHFQPPSPNLTASIGASYEESAHGFHGPLSTCITPHATRPGAIHNVFNETFQKLGVPPRPEFNGGELRGFGVQMVTQDGLADVREDAARAYYYPVIDRPNLVVMVNTTATRVLWSRRGSDGKMVASAAEVVGQNGDISTIGVGREVILSAGAIRSPGILERSGVGNPSVLSQQHIDVKVDLPAVGENLQDQTTMVMLASAVGQNYSGFPPFVAHTSLHDLYGANTSAVYSSTLAKLPQYAAAIARQNGGASTARTQHRLLMSQLDLLMSSNTPASEIAPVGLGNVVGAVFWPLHPFSRGSVHIVNDSNATATPRIDARFLEFDFDVALAVATAKFVRRFLTTPPVADILNVTTLVAPPIDADDTAWADWVKTHSGLQPNYHHLGTCAMLPRADGGVVDNDFAVYGTRNVRVVDLGIVPLQVAGHSTALLYGIAEWAALKIQKARGGGGQGGGR